MTRRGTETGGVNLDEALGESDEGFDSLLLSDVSSCLALALEDLPEKERQMLIVTAEADDPRKVEGTKKQKSRARQNLRVLYQVHQRNESREGARIIDLALFCGVEGPEDQKLAREHLFKGLSLDCMRARKDTGLETNDEVRHRFLRVARRIDSLCGEDYERAFYLLPETGKKILREGKYVFGQPTSNPNRPIVISTLDDLARERSAFRSLVELNGACKLSRSPQGRTSLFYRGKRAGEPGATLIKRLITNREIVEIVARELNLTEEQARELLLAALRNTETE